MKIIPVINVKTPSDFQKKVKELKNYNGLIQIDVSDGKFTDYKNLCDPTVLKNELRKVKFIKNFELHLMIINPLEKLNDWLELKPKRIFCHIEALKDPTAFLKNLPHESAMGLAFKPYTEVDKFYPYHSKIKSVLLLGVEPGPSGQKFRYHLLDKIKEFKKKYPAVKIQLDGGVNLEIALKAKEAGADEVAVGSYIFSQKEPLRFIFELEKKLL